jgi:hypothetical protein
VALNGDPNPIAAMLYGKGDAVEFEAADIEHLKGRYDDEVAVADAEIGRLLDELELSGLTESTLVVIAADHGESFMEHGHMKHCYHLFDHNVRTPLIMRVPGVAGGRRGRASRRRHVEAARVDSRHARRASSRRRLRHGGLSGRHALPRQLGARAGLPDLSPAAHPFGSRRGAD